MYSRWENSRAGISDTYCKLLRDIYGLSDEQLGFISDNNAVSHVDNVDTWELTDALTRSSISTHTLDEIERITLSYAERYGASAPDTMIGPVMRQMAQLQRTLTEPQPLAIRRRCVQALGVLSGIGANLSLDLGQSDRAVGLFNVGRLASTEAEDGDLAAWITTNQSIGPFYAGDYGKSIQLLDQAEANARDASSPRRRAWIASMRARALAAGGRSNEARRDLDEAYRLIDTITVPGHGTDFFDSVRLDGFTGSTMLLLQDTRSADALLTKALDLRAPSDAKGRALLTLDLASCRVVEGEPDEAVKLAFRALEMAQGAVVRPIVERVRQVRGNMRPWEGTQAVVDLDERLTTMNA